MTQQTSAALGVNNATNGGSGTQEQISDAAAIRASLAQLQTEGIAEVLFTLKPDRTHVSNSCAEGASEQAGVPPTRKVVNATVESEAPQ